MNIRTCKNCGRMFNYIGSPICPACRSKAEDEFQIAKKYIRDHPGCSAAEVAEVCEIELRQIRQWIREERLEFSSAAASGLNCERCGAMIKSGKYCDSCKREVASGINTVVDSTKPKPTEAKSKLKEKEHDAMRFLKPR